MSYSDEGHFVPSALIIINDGAAELAAITNGFYAGLALRITCGDGKLRDLIAEEATSSVEEMMVAECSAETFKCAWLSHIAGVSSFRAKYVNGCVLRFDNLTDAPEHVREFLHRKEPAKNDAN